MTLAAAIITFRLTSIMEAVLTVAEEGGSQANKILIRALNCPIIVCSFLPPGIKIAMVLMMICHSPIRIPMLREAIKEFRKSYPKMAM
jgi:hypothetical protein